LIVNYFLLLSVLKTYFEFLEQKRLFTKAWKELLKKTKIKGF
jgi:hypothetical protein